VVVFEGEHSDILHDVTSKVTWEVVGKHYALVRLWKA
jgi:hypothetical protein